MIGYRSSSSVHSHARGFTLVEMAVVMAVVSVLVASALGAYKVQVAKQYRDTTVERMKKIQDALATYRMRNDRIPCPASISAAPTSAMFGTEYKTSATSNCFNAAPPASAGITTISNTAATPANTTGIPTAKNIYIGAVPVKELGLPLEAAFDSWGRRFRYAVSSGLTSFDTTNHPFNPRNGVISVVDESGNPVGPVNGNPFFIISSGKDGAGGVTYEGKAAPMACPAASTRQGKNCSFANNQPFVYAQYAENNNTTTRFDDYVANDFGNASESAKNIDGLDDGISDWPATGNSATNVFLGYNSGGTSDVASVAAGTRNTGVGISTLQHTTTGGDNTALGYKALVDSSGSGNTAIGSQAMYGTGITGSGNTAVGQLALPLVATGMRNVAVGGYALSNMRDRNDMVAIGYQAHGSQAWGSDGTVAIGAYALQANGGGSASNSQNNVAVGFKALRNNWGNNNSALGWQALMGNAGGNGNAAFGTSALQSNTSGSNNTAFGRGALASNTSSSGNLAIGAGALQNSNVASYSNAAVGNNAGANTTTGTTNAVFGNDAFVANIDGGFNTVVGHWALTSSKHASSNTALGNGAMMGIDDGQGGNVAVGHVAMSGAGGDPSGGKYNTSVGDGTVAVGYGVALGAIAKAGADHAIAIGAVRESPSWVNTVASANSSIAIGTAAQAVTGPYSIAIGTDSSAGLDDTPANGGGVMAASYAGTNGIAIGYAASARGYQTIAIGGTARVDGDYGIAIGASPNEGSYAGAGVGPGDIVIGNMNYSRNAYIRANEVYFGKTVSGDQNGCLTASSPYSFERCAAGLGAGARLHAASYRTTSDARLKKDIQELGLGLDFIGKLRPVSYVFKNSADGNTNYGFLAQDIERIVGEHTNLVGHDDTPNKFMSVSYTDLIAPLVKAVQELAGKVEKLAHDVADIVAQLNPLKKTVEAQQAKIDALEKAGAAQNARIEALEKALAGMKTDKGK